jgi:hypothetical protein
MTACVYGIAKALMCIGEGRGRGVGEGEGEGIRDRTESSPYWAPFRWNTVKNWLNNSNCIFYS